MGSAATGDFNGDGVPDLATLGPSVPTVTSGLPGLASILLTASEEATTAATPVFLLPGTTHVLEANYAGDSNYSSSSSTTTLSASLLSTTLSLNAAASTVAQPVTLTATLAPYNASGHSTDGETVTFYNGGDTGSVLGTPTLKGGVATLTVTTFTAGLCTASATYGGDAVFAASSIVSTQFTLAGVPTTLTLNANLSSSIIGQPVTLTATLSPYTWNGHSSNGELITFYDYTAPFFNANPLGTASLSGGVATLTLSSIPAGSDTLQATYGGDAYLQANNVNGSPNEIEFTVSQVQPTLTLSASKLNSSYGQPVTLTATASPLDTYTPNNGTITFTSSSPNGSESIGTAILSSGVGSITVSTLPAGIDNLVATYSGDSGDSSATSSEVVEGVAKAGQTPSALTQALTSSGNAVTSVPSGTPVTLTATATNSGAPVTRGTVVFCDSSVGSACTGLAVLGRAQLTSNGTAAITLRLGIGTHSLQAIFNGNGSAGLAASTLSPLTVTGKYSVMTIPNGMERPGIQGVGPYGVPTPTGTVQIIDTSDSNFVLGTVQVVPNGPYDESYSSALFSSTTQTPATGTKPFAIAAGDFNHDGIPDLAVANSGADTVSVLLGKGDGTYQPQATYAVGNGAYSVAVGDFNGDGNPDLAVTNLSDNTASILLGNGDGTFQAQHTYGTGGGPNAVAVGDFNGDGNLDLAVVNQTDNTVSILLGNGDGTFQAKQPYATGKGPVSLVVGDFNGDGIPDLAVANNTDNTVSILLGKGDGSFPAPVPYTTGKNPISVTAGVFTSSGFLDLAVANLSDNTVSVLLGNGDGTFQSQATYATGNSPYAVVAGSLSGVGEVDLAVANSGDNTVTLLDSNGNGHFTAGSSYNLFRPYSTGAGPISIALGDLNGDGMTDMAVLNNTGDTVTVLLNESGPLATTYSFYPAGLVGTHMLEAVYSGDANFNGSTSPTVNVSDGPEVTSLTLTSSANPSNYGNAVTLTATLILYFPPEVGSDGDPVTFTSGGTTLGTGTLSSNVATLTTTALQVGTNSVQASYGGNSDLGPSKSTAFSLTVRPATLTVTGPNVARA
jgi:hypothetical protein